MGNSGAAKAPGDVSQEVRVAADSDAAEMSGSRPKETDAGTSVGPKVQPERRATFKDYLRVFSYATPLDFVFMVLGALASIGGGVTLPLMNVVFGRLVGNFNDYFTPGSTQEEGDFQKMLDKQSLYIFALFIARFGLNYINKLAFRMIGIRISATIRLEYLRSLFSQSVHVLDSMPSGAAASAITTTANTLQLGISEKLGIYVEYTATLTAAIIVAFTHSWSLTLVTFSAIVFIALVLGVLLPFYIKFEGNINKAQGKANSVATEAFSSIRMVASCGAEDRIAQKYSEWVKKARHYGLLTAPLLSVQFGLIFFGLYSEFALAFWYGTKSYYDGRLDSVSDVLIVLMSLMLMVVSLQQTATPIIAVTKAIVAATEFFVVIDAPRPKYGELKEPDVFADQDIVFTDVHFAYPSRPTKKVLDGLNLRIEANKNTAIVGPSGSGKSTIVGLILGWYALREEHIMAKAIPQDKEKEGKKKSKKKNERHDEFGEEEEEEANASANPEDTGPLVELRGAVSTCGHSLEELDIKWWRSQIGLVQQEPFLFNDSIFNNVAAGLIGTEWEGAPEATKRELVKTACVESFADEFIDRLPKGYDTDVGESGTKLSGGQRQRIAIARSIISKPKILILDEATSAIDVRGERIVQASLERASRGRTTITIAHRLSTIRNADRICVLQNGRVVEQGTHQSLLSDEAGVYYGLVHAQKLWLGDSEDETLAEEDITEVLKREKSAAESEGGNTEQAKKWTDKSLIMGFGRLLFEQKTRFPLYIIAIIGALGAGVGTPLQAYLFAKLVVVFQETGKKLLHDSAFWALMWFILAIGIGLSYFISMFAASNAEHQTSATYRQEYFESLVYQKTSYFDQQDNATGQLSARLSSDPQALRELLGTNIVMVMIGVFSLFGALAISFAQGWKLALVALCVTIPLGVFAGYFRIKYELELNTMNEAVFQESSKFAAESIGAFRTVSALVMEESIINRYERLLSGHVVAAFSKARWTTIIFSLSDSISLGCQALIFWYGGRLLRTGEYDVMGFLVTYMAVIQGAESAGTYFKLGPSAAQASAAANRILGARDSRNQDTASAGEQVPDTEGGVKIELRDVHFKYPTRDVSIFKGLNITIEKGQFAALVGASGSGKTSIVSLLERFYDLSQGSILFNGRDITDINVYEYRKLLSLVAQEPSLFQGTIRENVLMGVDPSTITEERLHQCCRDANIHDFIVSLPEGYDTRIGNRGVSLSGGQKQRVSIARALIRDPRVLLLDEATSSLDSESEKLVQAAFERVSKGRTTIAVAHRLATIQDADIIYVLGEGRVLEKGDHAELLRMRGVYWQMCQNQALDR